MKKIYRIMKWMTYLSILFFMGSMRISAYQLTCSYNDSMNNRTLQYQLKTTYVNDTNGLNRLYYVDNNGKENEIDLSCNTTDDGCLVSLNVLVRPGYENEGMLSCIPVYTSNTDGTYVTKYMGDGMPYTQLDVTEKSCDYPDDCNFYSQSYEKTEESTSSNDKNIHNKVTATENNICNMKDIPMALPIFISNIIKLFKIIVPIVLILMGMIDFTRAVISSDEKQMKESQSRFIRRILAAVIIFFVVAIVQFAFNAIGADNDNIVGCINCFVNGNCGNQKGQQLK